MGTVKRTEKVGRMGTVKRIEKVGRMGELLTASSPLSPSPHYLPYSHALSGCQRLQLKPIVLNHRVGQ